MGDKTQGGKRRQTGWCLRPSLGQWAWRVGGSSSHTEASKGRAVYEFKTQTEPFRPLWSYICHAIVFQCVGWRKRFKQWGIWHVGPHLKFCPQLCKFYKCCRWFMLNIWFTFTSWAIRPSLWCFVLLQGNHMTRSEETDGVLIVHLSHYPCPNCGVFHLGSLKINSEVWQIPKTFSSRNGPYPFLRNGLHGFSAAIWWLSLLSNRHCTVFHWWSAIPMWVGDSSHTVIVLESKILHVSE